MSDPAEIHELPHGDRFAGSGGGDGTKGLPERVRELEIRFARIDERVSSIKENMATKNDISNLKVWILGGVLGGIAVAAAIAATVVKAFF